MWAWAGPVSLGDACGLLGEEDLARGFATVTFTAPRQLVLLSNHSPWCDALVGGAWPTGRDCFPSRRAKRVLQATAPRIEASWVSTIDTLPTHGIYDLDWTLPV